MTPRPVAAPAKAFAPICPAMLETWIDTMTPIGMATSNVGNTDVLVMKAHWRTNSPNGN